MLQNIRPRHVACEVDFIEGKLLAVGVSCNPPFAANGLEGKEYQMASRWKMYAAPNRQYRPLSAT